MKKVFVSLCMAGAVLGMASCGTSKSVAGWDAIGGEWNIIEIDGRTVVPAPGQPFPFIGFNTADGTAYGNAGCNNLTGSFDLNAKPGTIDLSGLGATRRMCQDMTLEQSLLEAFGKVKRYKLADGKNLFLCASSNRPLLVLQRREAVLSVNQLAGKWMIESVAGKRVPTDMENRPFIEFDLTGGQVHGHAGCNIFNGELVTDANQSSAISFAQLITTMMSCPDMAIESSILNALNQVRSFGRLAGGGIGFYDAEGTLLMEARKLGS